MTDKSEKKPDGYIDVPHLNIKIPYWHRQGPALMDVNPLHISKEDKEKLSRKELFNDEEWLRQEKWDLRFLRLAKFYSEWSKDPSTKVGAVIVRDTNRQVSQGYNGFVKDDPDLEEDYLDRPTKLSKMIHAEHNAINWANQDLTGCTLYVYPMQPCSVCSEEHIVRAGITRVVTIKPSEDKLERWKNDFEKSLSIMKKYGIEYIEYKKEL